MGRASGWKQVEARPGNYHRGNEIVNEEDVSDGKSRGFNVGKEVLN